MTAYKIYGLLNPINNKYFYVGVTSMELKLRLNGHMNSLSTDKRKVEIIKSITESGHKPQIILLEEVKEHTKVNPKKIEKIWINKMINDGHPLTNRGLNGEGRKPSENPKISITIYVQSDIIDRHGGRDILREKIYNWL